MPIPLIHNNDYIYTFLSQSGSGFHLPPPVSRIGSKRTLKDVIYAKMPKHFTTYVEPFSGSASVFFGYDWGDNIKTVLNDLDPDMIKVFKLLKKGISTNDKKLKYFDTTDFSRLNEIYKSNSNIPIDELAKLKVQYSNTFGSIGIGKLYNNTNPSRLINQKRLNEYQEKLKHTFIYNKSYSYILNKYDSPDTFFNLDPPYENSEGLYKNSDFNFKELSNKLKSIKGKFLLSLNDSENIREIFKDFNISAIEVRGKGNNEIDANTRKEVFISNY